MYTKDDGTVPLHASAALAAAEGDHPLDVVVRWAVDESSGEVAEACSG